MWTGPPFGPPRLVSRPPTRKSISDCSSSQPSGPANQRCLIVGSANAWKTRVGDASRRVGERLEGQIECRRLVKHLLKYLAGRPPCQVMAEGLRTARGRAGPLSPRPPHGQDCLTELHPALLVR